MRLGISLIGALAVFAANASFDLRLECERFTHCGGWVMDAQFMDQMGSPYLLAHGLGRPVADASTDFTLAQAHTCTVWARTKNWSALWSTEDAAGKFTVRINGCDLPVILGAQGKGEWLWVKAGEVPLRQGRNTIALHDLTGFDGRVDAIVLNEGAMPPAEVASCAARACTHVKADLVVCGGGIAGICTAVSAARLGLKVALVEARPILGGANSSEVRVHLGGFQNLAPYPRLGDVVAEIGSEKTGNAAPAANYHDERKAAVVAHEKNIRTFLHTRIVALETNQTHTIVAVTGVEAISGARTRFEAPLFADCTGDAAVGFLAGADYRVGREGQDETHEDMAPAKGDRMVLGASVQWYTKAVSAPTEFPIEPWMIAFNEQNCEYTTRGDWDWETGMMRDMISEFERVRDYGMLVVYSNWAYLKSKSARKAEYACRELDWMAYVAGKRESRRLVGDHVLTQQDVFDYKAYPDGTCMTTWAIDLHYPMPSRQRNYAGEPFRSICTHNVHYAYPIPYRCFYSRNVPNLFMAGRNISVTHVALGTVRVMRTTGMMGEVVGMAAHICHEKACLPRTVYEKYLPELRALMTKGVGSDAWPKIPQDYNQGAMRKGVPAKK